MNAADINPCIRFMDFRTGTIPYASRVKAYDYRLFAMARGECEVELETNRFLLSEGACLVLPPDVAYRLYFSGPVTYYNINFSLGFLPGPSLHPDAPEDFNPDRMPERPDERFFPVPTLIENAPLEQFTAVWNEYDGREPYYLERSAALLKALLLQLGRRPKEEEGPMPEMVEQLKRYVREHCCEELALEELGRMYGYHPYSLNRIFGRYAHQPIHRYQLQCRMRRACELLTETTLYMNQISDELGFSTSSHFAQTFRQWHGVTPHDYRKGMR